MKVTQICRKLLSHTSKYIILVLRLSSRKFVSKLTVLLVDSYFLEARRVTGKVIVWHIMYGDRDLGGILVVHFHYLSMTGQRISTVSRRQ